MRILHITDSHGTVKSPEGRTDIYYLSFLKKMYELKYVIKNFDIKLVIHTGDLFHSPRVSDKFTGQLAEIIKSYGIPMYVVPGNHDIDGYNINTLDQTKLGLLYKTGVIKRLDRDKNPIQLKSQSENLVINIAGQEYYKDIDNGNMSDFEMRTNQNADFNILAIHGYLCDKPQHPNIKHTLCQNIVTDADVILSGHFHESFEYHGVDFDVYNPGSMMRVDQTSYNETHMPQYGILEITNNNGIIEHNYTMHQFKIAEPSDKIFDYNLKNRKKKTLVTLDNFKNSITNTNLNNDLSVSIENIISDVAKNMSVTQDIIDKTVDIYHDALNNSPDKLEVQQGFISDTERKIIESVEIHNFQSHEDTIVKFKDGLNAIIGESNSGKTSILRAIRWCLDDDPHGSDFITTGQDDCSVTIIFSDGTKIQRKRTRNSSGTYDVVGKTIQPDGTISKWQNIYKGFANNIPVDIANIHQMPKINLTKDICTHLNMMSQFDGPFLVTDSPQVRASIIGRLTGTQIVDLSIKETNKEILNNSKLAKTYTQERDTLSNELIQYDYLKYYDEYLILFKSASKELYERMQLLDKVNDSLSEINGILNVINSLKDKINNISNNIDCYNLMLSIKQYILKQYEYVSLYNELIDISNHISVIKTKINWLIILISFKSFVENFNKELKTYISIKLKLERLSNIKTHSIEYTNIINQYDKDKSLKQEYISLANSIQIYINVLSKDVSNIKPLYEKYINIENNISNYTNQIQQFTDNLSNVMQQLDNISKQQEQLIAENNICPCCGQKITTKKSIQNIKNFMKGKFV